MYCQQFVSSLWRSHPNHQLRNFTLSNATRWWSVVVRNMSESNRNIAQPASGACTSCIDSVPSVSVDTASRSPPCSVEQTDSRIDGVENLRDTLQGTHSTVGKVPGTQMLSKRALKKLKRENGKRLERERKSAKRAEKLKETPNNLNFEEDNLNETSYYFHNDLRKVYPYFFTFSTYTKGRWVGQGLKQMLTDEFLHDSVLNVDDLITSGRVTVNGAKVDTSYVLKDPDFIENRVHRHEVPVTSDPIKIVENNADVVVVNKPSSIPVHPCGRYRHNSVVYILAKDHGITGLRIAHRLDRLTSGLLLLCKTGEATRRIQDNIKDREVEKEYVCRVDGYFPSGTVECNEPIDVLSPKLGVYRVGPNGKESSTVFERLSYNGKTSVVKWFPIINDPLYNNGAWGPQRGKAGDYGQTDEELIAELTKQHNYKNHLLADSNIVDASLPNNNQSDISSSVSTSRGTDQVDPVTESSASQQSPSFEEKQTIAVTGPTEGQSQGCIASSGGNVEPTVQSTSVIGKEIRIDGTNGPTLAEGELDLNTSTTVHLTSSKSTVFSDCLTKVHGGTHIEQEGTEPQTKKAKIDRMAVCGQGETSTYDPRMHQTDPNCLECRRVYRDPLPVELVMYLHALRYKGQGWEYHTELPTWAQPDWNVEG